MLEQINSNPNPESGYAWSLYNLITGIKLPLEYPNLDELMPSRDSVENREKIILDNYKIYPNPTGSQLVIESDVEIHRVVIFDINGNVMNSTNFNNRNISIDVQDYLSGIYLIEFHDSNNNLYQDKFLKI